ncbi:MAG TPA: (2Fe-2S)-binding protein [Planctomycetaceae bacterium]|nr:(2Fe-2S)-binding protein [Planctomycetaceae bacterium]
MEPDDELCLCFHVTRRKVEQFLRTNRPAVASQLSECFGAGTGCGWCRPFLKRLHEQSLHGTSAGQNDLLPAAEEYSVARQSYRASQRTKSDEP